MMRLIAPYLPSVHLLCSEYFVVMNNIMMPTEGSRYLIEERYDLKGSVINRHGKLKARDEEYEESRTSGRVRALQ